MKTLRLLCIAPLAVTIITLALPTEACAFPGVTGKTNKTGGAGCAGNGCHAGPSGTFTISGPTTLAVGQTGTYTITFPGNSKTAANVAASDGALAKVTNEFTLSSGELTFTASRNANTWQFSYTPSTTGSKTLYAACVVNGRPGSWNHAADFPVSVTPVSSVESETPRIFSLEQNYPNPFNPTTTISYSIAKNARVTLNVYSVAGTLAATLVNENQAPGSYRVQFDGAGLATGVYVYRLTAGDVILSRKLVLLK